MTNAVNNNINYSNNDDIKNDPCYLLGWLEGVAADAAGLPYLNWFVVKVDGEWHYGNLIFAAGFEAGYNI